MSRTVWRQFAIALVVMLAYALFSTIRSYQVRPQFIDSYGGLFPYLGLNLPGWIVQMLPIAGAIGVSLLPIRAGSFRTALLVAGVTTAVMVGYDLLGRVPVSRMESVAYIPDSTGWRPPIRLDDTTGVIRRTLLQLGGRVRPQDIQKWPPDTTTQSGFTTIKRPETVIRLSATRTYTELTHFAFPFVLIGVIIGLGVWLSRIATFRRERDERVLRLVLGWVLALAVGGYVSIAQQQVNFSVSAWGQSMFWIFSPLLLACVPAFLGWRAIWRLDRIGAD